jgi:hypothetical protein
MDFLIEFSEVGIAVRRFHIDDNVETAVVKRKSFRVPFLKGKAFKAASPVTKVYGGLTKIDT